MKKINIIQSDTDRIDSFLNLNIEELKGITNGTCDEIICTILDKLEYSDRIAIVHLISKKIANLGFITLKFLNATKLSKDVAKGNVNSQFMSKIILENKSLFIESDMIEILSQINNVSIHKSYNDNQYIVMVLQKNI